MQLRRFGIIALVLVLALLGWGAYRYGIKPSADIRSVNGQILTATGVAVGGIVTASTDGSVLLNLTPNTFDGIGELQSKSRHPSASRTGSRIAFASNRDDTGWRIYTMDQDGGAVRQLTERPDTAFPGNNIDDHHPVISPDGSRVAFISQRDDVPWSEGDPTSLRGISNVYVVNVDGTNLQRVTQHTINPGGGPGGTTVRAAAWSPDGSKLAISGLRYLVENDRGSFVESIALVDVATGAEQILTQVGNDLTNALDWAPDGQTIVFSRSERGVTTYQLLPLTNVTVAGPITVLREDTLGTYPSGSNGTIRFSPDSQYLAYTRGTVNGELVIRSVSGGESEALPHKLGRDEALWWSAAPALTTPSSMALEPSALELSLSGTGTLEPIVRDATGRVLARSVARWSGEGINAGSPKITNAGTVTASNEERTDTICGENAGLSACATIYSGLQAPASTTPSQETGTEDPTDSSNTDPTDQPPISQDPETTAGEPPVDEPAVETPVTANPDSIPPMPGFPSIASQAEEPTSETPSGERPTVDESTATTDEPPAADNGSPTTPTGNSDSETPPVSTPETTSPGASTPASSTGTPPTPSVGTLPLTPPSATASSTAAAKLPTATTPPPATLTTESTKQSSQSSDGTTSSTDGTPPLSVVPGEKLSLSLPKTPKSPVVVAIDGKAIGSTTPSGNSAAIDIPLPNNLEPGTHTLTASSSGWTSDISLPVEVASASQYKTWILVLIGLLALIAAGFVIRYMTASPIGATELPPSTPLPNSPTPPRQ